MEPTLFYVGLYFLVSLLHLASSRVDSYNGWKNSPNVQYHIQTDEGEERYFKYQTKSGQYRKEKRLQDGTVVGTYGWVDPNGYLRLRDYIADNQGYRILKTKTIYVGDNPVSDGDSTPGSFHSKYSTVPTVSFQFPPQGSSHRFSTYKPPSSNSYIPPSSGSYSPSSPNSYTPPSSNPYVPPYFSQPGYQIPVTTTPSPTTSHSLPSSSTPLVPYSSYYPSSIPLVEVSPNSISQASTPLYGSSTSAPSVAILENSTPKPLAVYSSTPKPVAVNYVSTPQPSSTASAVGTYSSTPSPTEHTTASAIPAIGYISSTPPPPPPPISGKFAFFDRNNNFVTETEKNKLFFQNEDKNNFFSDSNVYKGYDDNYQTNDYRNDFRDNDYRSTFQNNNYRNSFQNYDYDNAFQEYDGVSTVQNGFRYYLPRHYHEEKSSHDGQERTGSFGYIDPFGIRRVIYYNTAPGTGFLHRKNNRYVGFHSTPYDPRPSF